MNSILLMVVLLAPLHAIPETRRGYHSHSSQEFRNDRHQTKLILYRSAGLPYQHEPSYHQDRRPYRGGSSPFPNRDVRRYPPAPPQNADFVRWHRTRFNTIPVPYRNYIDKRVGFDYPNRYGNNFQKQKFPPNREDSIADYVKRFNYEHNPHAAYYNSPEDSSYNHQPIEEEIYTEGEPEGLKQLIHSFPPLDFNPGQAHKDVTKASFPESGPVSDGPGFPGGHRFSPNKEHTGHEEHHRVYYEKTEDDGSDAASDDRDIDPELIELYKKIIEAYTKKQKHKKVNGNSGFYFKNTSTPKEKPLFFLQNEQIPEEGNKRPPSENGKSNFVIPRPPSTNRIVFPGPLQTYRPDGPMTNFKPSPQFNKYSEPDPLYHPNGNPFETYDPPKMYPLPTPVSKELSSESSSSMTNTTTVSSEPETEKTKFPDSINAQLPPPENDTDTRIPYVADPMVTPRTSTESISETKVTERTVSQFAQTDPTTGLPKTETTTPTENPSKEAIKKLIQSTLDDASNSSSSSSSSSEEDEEKDTNNQGNTTDGTTLQTAQVTKGASQEETTDVPGDDKANTTPNMDLFFLPTTIGTEEIPQGAASRETTVVFENFTPHLAQDNEDKATTFRRYSTPPNPTSTAEFVRIINSPTLSLPHQQITKVSQKKDKTSNNGTQKQTHEKAERSDDDLHSTLKPGRRRSQHKAAFIPTTVETKPATTNNPADDATTPYAQENETGKTLLYLGQTDEFKTNNGDSGKHNKNSIEHLTVSKHGDLTFKNDNSHFSKDHDDRSNIKKLSAYENQNTLSNFHYIMSIINQARSHVLLSQNHSAVLDV